MDGASNFYLTFTENKLLELLTHVLAGTSKDINPSNTLSRHGIQQKILLKNYIT